MNISSQIAANASTRTAHAFGAHLASTGATRVSHPLAISRQLRLRAQEQNLTLAQSSVLFAISDFRDSRGVAFPALPTIALHACCAERTVQDAIPVLVDKGLLSILKPASPRSSTVYRVNLLSPGSSTADFQRPLTQPLTPQQQTVELPQTPTHTTVELPVTVEVASTVELPTKVELVDRDELDREWRPAPLRGAAGASEVPNEEDKDKNARTHPHTDARRATLGPSHTTQTVELTAQKPIETAELVTPQTPLHTSPEQTVEPRKEPTPSATVQRVPSQNVQARAALVALVAALGLGDLDLQGTRADRRAVNRVAHAALRVTEAKERATRGTSKRHQEPLRSGHVAPIPSRATQTTGQPQSVAPTAKTLFELPDAERAKVAASLKQWRTQGLGEKWRYPGKSEESEKDSS